MTWLLSINRVMCGEVVNSRVFCGEWKMRIGQPGPRTAEKAKIRGIRLARGRFSMMVAILVEANDDGGGEDAAVAAAAAACSEPFAHSGVLFPWQ